MPKFYEVTCTTTPGVVLNVPMSDGSEEKIELPASGSKLVPAELWERWISQHAGFPMVKDGTIHAAEVTEDEPEAEDKGEAGEAETSAETPAEPPAEGAT